jgi:D-glycerate 3-kinase
MAEAALVEALTQAIAATSRQLARPIMVGISGVQGSGKSTLCAQLEARLAAHGLRAATLSLDDLYLTRTERGTLAATVHPLFATRGVPGTHDLALADDIVTRLLAGSGPVAIPRFDKGNDERAPQSRWPVVTAPLDVLLFEGWCIAATPQAKSALVMPANALEAAEDPDLVWRTCVNDALGDGYARLFARIDRLIVLAAPGFAVVRAWRHEQEAGLKAQGGDAAGMDPARLDRFIAHFERLSRHMLAVPPPEGAIIVQLNEARGISAVSGLAGVWPQQP